MIITTLRRFTAARRSAVALTFAASILPLMLLVGIAIDFTLLSQARSQSAFAAQAAATHAVRVADATYALEVQNNSTATLATAHAIAAANNAGNTWFYAELGSMSFASISAESTNTTSTNNSSSPPNFTAAVSYTFSYPPIFDPLFGHPNTKWVYASSATATSQFAYAQVLMMLDTSGSMLIGANQSDIQTMEQGSVCPKQGYLLPLASDGYTTASSYAALSVSTTGIGLNTNTPSSDNDAFYLSSVSKYNETSSSPNYPNYIGGQCVNGYGVGANSIPSSPAYLYLNGASVSSEPATEPAVDCALGCHFTTNTVASDGYYGDLYGMARREKVTLRLDVVLQATEQVISSMISSEATSNQFAIGIYQFNTDVLPLVNSTTGTGGALPEATNDLPSALSKIQNVDYTSNSLETTFPVLTENNATYSTANFTHTPEEIAHADSMTNFTQSMTDLLAGGASPTSSSGKLQPLTQSGSGGTTSTPEKFMFIVTDGLEDSSPVNGGGENGNAVAGEMTSVAGEKAGTGTCSALKSLGYTVYVLYVAYYPMADNSYYTDLTYIGRQPTGATVTDNSNATSTNTTIQSLSEVPSIAGGTLDSNGNDERYSTSPDGLALQACASSPADFYTASSSTQIKNALSKMLKSALASTTRLTN